MNVGIVLAAGRSTRFGRANKLLAPFRGKPLAAHAADAMRGVTLVHRLAVVQDEALVPVFEGFDIVRPEIGSGQAASVVAGVTRAMSMGAGRVLIALADMPFVDAALMQAVLDRCDDRFGAGAVGYMPPAAFPAARFADLLALTGDRGAGSLLRDLPEGALVAAPPLASLDIDTRDDLERLDQVSAQPQPRP